MRFFHKTLQFKKEESVSVILFLLLGLFIGCHIALTEVSAISMFVKSWKQDDLPMAFFFSGLSGIIISHFYTKLNSWIPISILAIYGLAILFIGNLFIFYSFRITSDTYILYFAFIFLPANYIIPFQLFWGFFYKIYSPLQIKRLSIRIEIGIITGCCTALYLVIYFINEQCMSVEYSYLLSSTLLILIGITVIIFSFHFSIINKLTNNVQYINAYNNYYNLLQKPYTRSIIYYSILSGFSAGFIDFILYSILTDKYETTYEVIVYLSISLVLSQAFGYLITTTIVTKINKQYGNKISLLLLPSFLLASSVLYTYINFYFGYNTEDDSFYLLFMIAAGSKILYIILYKGFEFPIFRTYFIPIEIELRYNFQSKAESFSRQLGYLATGIITIISIYLFEIHFSDLYVILVLSIIAWLSSAFILNKIYRTTLQIFLKEETEIKNETIENNSFTDKLVFSIEQLNFSTQLLSLNLLSILDPIKFKKVIKTSLYSENSRIQTIALYHTNKFCMLETLDVLEILKKSKKYSLSKNRALIFSTYIKIKKNASRLLKNNYVEQLSLSKIISERRLGALLVTYSDNTMKNNLLAKLFRDSDFQVRYNAIAASSKLKNKEIYNYLIQTLSDQKYSKASLAAILEGGEELFPHLESAFSLNSQSEKIQRMIIKIYSRSGSKKAIPLLLKKIKFENITIMNSVIDALNSFYVLLEEDEKIPLRRELEEVCQVIVWNMSAYNNLIYHSTSDILLLAIKSEIEDNYEMLFKILSLLYNSKSVSQIKENIDSTIINKKEFALQLLEALIAEELKPILLPILSKDSYDITVKKLEQHFLLAPIDDTELLYDLIQRDYKWINRWTKACALNELVKSRSYINTDIFISNLANPDRMLQEVSATALSIIEKSDLIIPSVIRKEHFITEAAFTKIAGNAFFSERKFEQIRFLKETRLFKEIPFRILSEIAIDMLFTKHKKDEQLIQYDSPEDGDYFLVKEGLIELKINEHTIHQYTKGSFIHFLNYFSDPTTISIKLEAKENSVVYKMSREVFDELIFSHEEIAKAILKL